jgi:drug/metabolite transporter (DMT)-like permease
MIQHLVCILSVLCLTTSAVMVPRIFGDNMVRPTLTQLFTYGLMLALTGVANKQRVWFSSVHLRLC